MKHVLLVSCMLSLAACSGTSPAPGPTRAPDFLLQDLSPNSATSGQDVSPRDFLGVISAWYFGDAT